MSTAELVDSVVQRVYAAASGTEVPREVLVPEAMPPRNRCTRLCWFRSCHLLSSPEEATHAGGFDPPHFPSSSAGAAHATAASERPRERPSRLIQRWPEAWWCPWCRTSLRQARNDRSTSLDHRGHARMTSGFPDRPLARAGDLQPCCHFALEWLGKVLRLSTCLLRPVRSSLVTQVVGPWRCRSQDAQDRPDLHRHGTGP